jgi:hypothetical protein
MEELLLGGFLSFQEMDVVDEEQVDLAVAPAELRGRPPLD